MKTTAETYQQMKTATLKFIIEDAQLSEHLAVELVQGVETNAYKCILEQDDDEGLEMPWVNGDYSDLADKFVGSIYGGVEYHFGHLGNWSEIYAAVEACAEAVLAVKASS